MKQVFLDVTAQLDTALSLKWVDEDKGQMNFERPPVLFPCALVDIQITNAEKMGGKLLRCDALVTVRMGFDFTGNTSTKTPAEARAKSLEYYDIVEEVKKKLNGWSGGNFNALEFKNFYPEKRPDGYKVQAMVFATQFLDDTAG